uniref:Uncharacterized protein n=1 Tax=Rhizochromulina marina TaxID=1034831 RepID=A0A7S2WV72_9STRA
MPLGLPWGLGSHLPPPPPLPRLPSVEGLAEVGRLGAMATMRMTRLRPLVLVVWTFILAAADDHAVRNTLLHYGHYCGPGPQLLEGCQPPLEPVDHVDAICMRHDCNWCHCFSKAGPMKRGKPHPLVLSTRFLTLPAPIYRLLFDEPFRECIRLADQRMLEDMDVLIEKDRLPEWWDKWTRNKFHTYLLAFRKSVARDDRMSDADLRRRAKIMTAEEIAESRARLDTRLRQEREQSSPLQIPVKPSSDRWGSSTSTEDGTPPIRRVQMARPDLYGLENVTSALVNVTTRSMARPTRRGQGWLARRKTLVPATTPTAGEGPTSQASPSDPLPSLVLDKSMLPGTAVDDTGDGQRRTVGGNSANLSFHSSAATTTAAEV